jgi:hypothetical protein
MARRAGNLSDAVYISHVLVALVALFGSGSLLGGYEFLVEGLRSETAQTRTALGLSLAATVLFPVIVYGTIKHWKRPQFVALACLLVSVMVVRGIWLSVLYLAVSLVFLGKYVPAEQL